MRADLRKELANKRNLYGPDVGGRQRYRNPVAQAGSTLGPTTLGTKRKHDEDSDLRPSKAIRTHASRPSTLGRRNDSGVTVANAVVRLGAANMKDAGNPSERPFPFAEATTHHPERYYDSSHGMTIAPTHLELLPPPNASKLPTGLDPYATPFKFYYPGLIVTAPWIEIAMSPNASPAHDRDFVHTRHGIVCAKRRMLLVLWTISDQSFLAIPISSHTKRGLVSVDPENLKYHICLQDFYGPRIENKSPHEPLIVTKMRDKAMGIHSSIDLTSAGTIRHGIQVDHVGYLSRKSSDYVVREYKRLQEASERRGRGMIPEIDPTYLVQY